MKVMKAANKSELRKQLRSERLKLTENVASKFSEQITQRLIGHIPWKTLIYFHCYVPVSKDLEVNSWHILKYVWLNYPDIQTVVPRINQKKEYESVLVSSKTKWLHNGVRIPEPIGGVLLDDSVMFDVVIVPMLGFDESGHRLGQGLGWYDRFLATQSKALTIGLCYEFGLVDFSLPVESHDVALKYIVSEETVRKF